MNIWARIKQYFNLQPVRKTDREAYIIEQEAIQTPWATFEIAGFEVDGRVKVMFNWNNAFIQKIQDLGFQAETEEDSVQLFFYAAQLKPTELTGGDDPVQSNAHPQLSGQQNMLMT